MVSRLLSSLSGLLVPSPTDEKANDSAKNDAKLKSNTTNNNTKGKDDTVNNKTSQHSLGSQPSANLGRSEYEFQFMNAESLDRAIVNRLQSKLNTSVADALEHPNSASRVKSRCEDGIPRMSSRLFQKNKPSAYETQSGDTRSASTREIKALCAANAMYSNVPPSTTGREPGTETMFETVFSELPMSRQQSAASLLKDTVSQSSVMSHGTPTVHSSATRSFKLFSSEDKKPTEYPASAPLEESFPEERRSIMYRNSQFSLENSSREALCSSSSKLLLNTNVHSDTSLHFPMFGIPDPSLPSPRPSLTSSTETLRGSISRNSRESAEYNNARKSQRRRSTSPTMKYSYLAPRISEGQIGDHLLDSTINDIIERGGDEFKAKYSSWIWDAFRSQLLNFKSLMIAEFNEKIKRSLEDREQEIAELQKRYRQKLAEFDSTTENFQQLMDNAYRDNQRMLRAKDFVIDKLKKEFLECKKHFEQDLQRQMQGYRAEAEVERTELQKRNDELMLIMLTDHSNCGLEEAFKNEVESLHQLIKRLTAQNEELHQQLAETTSSASSLNKSTIENLESQLECATLEVAELRRNLQFAEREKEDLTVSYHQEIAKLNRKIQESNTRYDHQLRDAAEEIEMLRKKHARDTKDLKNKIASQELQHTATINEVKQQYGGQVESLSFAVSQLRDELTAGGSMRHSH